MTKRSWIFTILAAASLLIAVLISVLWVRVLWTADQLRWGTRGIDTKVGSASGVLYIERSGGWSADPRDQRAFEWSSSRSRIVSVSSDHWVGFKLLGFAWVRYSLVVAPRSSPTYLWFVSIPYWFLWCTSVTLPISWIVRRRKALIGYFRKPDGVCKSCGYDLRATPDRCPECGTPVNRPHGSPATEG